MNTLAQSIMRSERLCFFINFQRDIPEDLFQTLEVRLVDRNGLGGESRFGVGDDTGSKKHSE